LFRTAVTLNDGNTTVSVPVNNLKFSIGVSAWPFASPSNFLLFGARVETPGLNDDGQEDAEDSDDDKTKIDFGESNIVLQNSAIADGVQVPVTATLSKKDIDWKFPAFVDRLEYASLLPLRRERRMRCGGMWTSRPH
jgi:hypothetical protein